jgi:hypothetical protein
MDRDRDAVTRGDDAAALVRRVRARVLDERVDEVA